MCVLLNAVFVDRDISLPVVPVGRGGRKRNPRHARKGRRARTLGKNGNYDKNLNTAIGTVYAKLTQSAYVDKSRD